MQAAQPSSVSSEWYRDAFGELYPVLYAHRTVEAASDEAAFAVACMGLPPGACVLDAGCGAGRHGVHLAGAGYRVTGVDLSPTLLALAYKRQCLHAHWVQADWRALPLRMAFDAVTCFFTSFGYFQEPDENFGALCEMARVLKPGGRFFLDHLNRDYLIEHLVPVSERRVGDLAVRESRWIEHERVNKCTEVYRNDQAVAVLGESVQLFTQAALGSLLQKAGLAPDRWFGDYAGGSFEPTRPRMIVTGGKW